MNNLKFQTQTKYLRTTAIIILLIASSFQAIAQGGGTQVKSKTVSGTHTIENGSFDYTTTVIYQLHDAGYGDDPSAIRLGVKNFTITRLNLRIEGAQEVIGKKSFPKVLNDINVDIDGNLTLRKGNSRYSLGVTKKGITAKNNFNAFNSFDFGKSHNNQIQRIFGKDISYNDLDFSLNNVNLKLKTSYFSFISDIKSEIKNNQRRKQKEKEDKIRREAIANKKQEESQRVKNYNTDYSGTNSNSQLKKDTQGKARKRQQELERKRSEEQKKIEAYTRIKKQQEAELQRKQTENQIIANTAVGAAGIIAGGAADGVFTGVDLTLGYREYDEFGSILSYELGVNVGNKGAFTIGYIDAEESGFVAGLNFDVLRLAEADPGKYSLRINIGAEFGLSEETFYGGYVGVRILEILNIGYGYGVVENENSGFSGEYSGFRGGFHINF